MLKKAKVVNIKFQDFLKKSLAKRSSECNENSNLQTELNLEAFMNSSQSTTETSELLKIIKSPPINLTEFIRQKQFNTPSFVSQENKTQEIHETDEIFLNQTKVERKNSRNPLDIQASRYDSPFVDTPAGDQENHNNENTEKIRPIQPKSSFYSQVNTTQRNERFQTDENVYLIPQKYVSNLYLILTHFLNYKMMYPTGKQNHSRTSYLPKRPRTTIKNLLVTKVKQTSRDSKPFTSITQNRQQSNENANSSFEKSTNNFNEYFEKIIQMEKEIQKKSKRIIFLQSQLTTCYETIRQKNAEIKEYYQKQNFMKKKLKYQIERVMKCKAIAEINEVYVNNFSEQKSSGKSIFEINGKKFTKSQFFQNFTETAFLTSPKLFSTQKFSEKEETSKLSNTDTDDCEMLSKSQPMAQLKKGNGKGGNKKLQVMKLTKLVEGLTKEITKFENEREKLLDNLAENNGKIEKTIGELESAITMKKMNVEKFTEELGRLKEQTA